MALDFPATPTTGQTFDPGTGIVYSYDGVAWNAVTTSTATAERRNRVVNPGCQHSQENGDTGSALVASAVYWPADQWQVGWSLTGTAQCQRGRPAPDTNSDYVYFNIGTATASPAAAAYAQIIQAIEGGNIKDFQWGTASAKQVVVRINFFASIAGTYTLSVKNGAIDRTYLTNFSAVAAFKVYTFVIPGDVTGTWATDNSTGLIVGVGLASGTTYGGGIAGWQAGNKVQMTGASNGAATAGAGFALTDVGLYLDPDRTGLAPKYELPDYGIELDKCMRYWEPTGMTIGVVTANAYNNTTWYKVQKRTTPTFTVIVGTLAPAAIATVTYAPLDGYRQTATTAAAADLKIAASARM